MAALGWRVFLLALMGASFVSQLAAVDLSKAALFELPGRSKVEAKAAGMLNDEVARRTQIRLGRHSSVADAPLIYIGTARKLASVLPASAGPILAQVREAESYRIWFENSQGVTRLIVAGADDRGALFGTGYLLRQLVLGRQKVSLPDTFEASGAPKMKLRGHQLGYRQKTNSYDAWDVPMWEQYLRDLAIFGCNTIELIPPRSDDDPDSPHFPLPPMEMMIEMSRLADEYGMDVWLWYPAMDPNYADPKTVDAALVEWGEVFRLLPRVDAVFVPGGDPGHTQPKHLFNLLEKQSANLHRYHPKAAMWLSPQSFGSDWMEEFFGLMRQEPEWLAGIVYGPQVRMPLDELRTRIPRRYPIRDYPDITHSRHCQYPVPNWDLAYAVTEGREAINPRPTQMAHIFRTTTLRHSIGFITYSEGCNDDVNKAVWSALGWNPDSDVYDVLEDYSRYFIGGTNATLFAKLLAGLEQNWVGAIATNTAIKTNLTLAQELEQQATPQQKLNWRFQQALYRAYYDAYVQQRLAYEVSLEQEALGALRAARETGSTNAIARAEAILAKASKEPVATDLRARLFELGEALFQSIRMQLSTDRYQGEPGRGSNLNEIDHPLNNSQWLLQEFRRIRAIPSEADRVLALGTVTRWSAPGPGGFYDDLGDPRHQPHLVSGKGWDVDPGFFETPQVGFTYTSSKTEQAYPKSWWTSAENLYDAPIRMHYANLEPKARYKLRVVYGLYKNNAPVRLVANETTEVHGWLNRPGEMLEFDLPPATTASGELNLAWQPTPGRGGNGRVLDIAEVWLLRADQQ